MTAALPSLPPRLTPRAKRTLILQSKPPRLVISSAATVTETASRKAKWPAASVRLVTRESSVRRPKLDEAAFPRSSASSYSSLYWLLLLLFSLKGTDHEEECVSAPWLNIKVIFCRVLSNCVTCVEKWNVTCWCGVNRRAWASIRSRSMEKETLMANMGLPCEHYDSDAEVKLQPRLD